MRIKTRLRKLKLMCCGLVITLVLAVILACVALGVLVSRASGQSPTERQPLDVVLVIDNSNSMWEKEGIGSDPDLLRIDAAQLFISYLGVDTAVADNRLAVVSFGTESELIVSLTSLGDQAQREAVKQAIEDPRRMGWTDVNKALNMAYRELFESERLDPTHSPAVILLTDGKPELSSKESREDKEAYVGELRGWGDRFKDKNCPVFTVALSNEATDADPDIQTYYRNIWQEVAASTPPAAYYEARTAADLLKIYHDIVVKLMGKESGDPVIEREVVQRVIEKVPVEEKLERVTFVVLKSEPGMAVRVTRPCGLPAQAGDPDVNYAGQPGASKEEIWSIRLPQSGDWLVELDGQGYVIVWKDYEVAGKKPEPEFQVQLREPAPFVAGGQPLRIVAALLDSADQVVIDPQVHLTARLTRAGFTEGMIHLFDDGQAGDETAGDGFYAGQYVETAPTQYTLHLSAMRGESTLAGLQHQVGVIALPRLAVSSPTVGTTWEAGQPITASASLEVGGRASGALIPDDITVSALLNGLGGEEKVLPLARGGDGVFSGTIAGTLPPGGYTLTVHLAGQTREGLPFEDKRQVVFSVLAPPRRKTMWALAVGGVSVLLAAGVGWKVLSRRRRPVVEGTLVVLAAPVGQESKRIELDTWRKPLLWLGQGSQCEIRLAGAPDLLDRHAVIRVQPQPDGQIGVETAPSAEAGKLDINGREVRSGHILKDGDIITLAQYKLRYENLRQAGRERSSGDRPRLRDRLKARRLSHERLQAK